VDAISITPSHLLMTIHGRITAHDDAYLEGVEPSTYHHVRRTPFTGAGTDAYFRISVI